MTKVRIENDPAKGANWIRECRALTGLSQINFAQQVLKLHENSVYRKERRFGFAQPVTTRDEALIRAYFHAHGLKVPTRS